MGGINGIKLERLNTNATRAMDKLARGEPPSANRNKKQKSHRIVNNKKVVASYGSQEIIERSSGRSESCSSRSSASSAYDEEQIDSYPPTK